MEGFAFRRLFVLLRGFLGIRTEFRKQRDGNALRAHPHGFDPIPRVDRGAVGGVFLQHFWSMWHDATPFQGPIDRDQRSLLDHPSL